MPITFNGTNISYVFFNSTLLTTVVFNGTTVYTSAPAQTQYYTNGTQNVAWTTGYSLGSFGFVSFGSSSIFVYAGSSSGESTTNQRTARTTNTVDLTNISTLYIDWQGITSSPATLQTANFIVSTSSTGTFSTFNARTQVIFSSFGGDRRTSSLDVSGLTGNYFIRVHSRDGSSTFGRWNEIIVYRVWGE
jgi:hypothetical protein